MENGSLQWHPAVSTCKTRLFVPRHCVNCASWDTKHRSHPAASSSVHYGVLRQKADEAGPPILRHTFANNRLGACLPVQFVQVSSAYVRYAKVNLLEFLEQEFHRTDAFQLHNSVKAMNGDLLHFVNNRHKFIHYFVSDAKVHRKRNEQTDRETDRQTHRQTDRQTERS